MEWINKAKNEEKEHHDVLSFSEYIESLENNPRNSIRPSYVYLKDMLEFFGKNKAGAFNLFKLDSSDSPTVCGQEKTQDAIYQNIVNFHDEGFNNKFVLLVGPNGSAKSSIVGKLMKGIEDYSLHSEGKLHSFSWVFPIQNYIKGSLGLTKDDKQSNELQSYANLSDKDINAILPSELKDHPILLIPRKYRQEYIDNLFKDSSKEHEIIKKSYLYSGDLSKRNKMIYDALLKSYKGDHEEVLKHIRVERLKLSRRYSNGAVTIEPQLHADAKIQQITMDKRLSNLPPSLQSLNLFTLQGEVILANRGILEFSDLLKRPLDTFKYLLQTMETSSLNLQGVLTDLDIFFIGTSNEIHMQAFKQHPDFNSFKGRFNFIKVPYLLNFKDEKEIYRDQIDSLIERTHFEPLSLDILCLYAVMTRIRAPKENNYKDKKLAKIITTFTPLEKTFLLSNSQSLPERLDIEAKQIIKYAKKTIENEYDLDPEYEGKFGISPRDIKKILFKVSSKHSNVTFVEILEYLEEMILKKTSYDWLNINPEGDYHNNQTFLVQLKNYALNLFDKELRDSLGLIDDRSYEEFIKRYIINISALIKGEKIKNTITGKFEDVDDFFLKEFEKNIHLDEDITQFREHLISQLGAYSLDNPGKSFLYADVFPVLIKKLQESFRKEQRSIIDEISRNLVFFEAELNGNNSEDLKLSEKSRKLIKTTIDTIKEKYLYSTDGAFTLLKYLIKEKY